MAETENIAKMAERISKEIFSAFKWEKVGPTNINWPCNHQEEHEKKTHPSDVVFTYKEPYSSNRTYLNVDLKSYAIESITPLKVQKALESLAMTIECASKCKEWSDYYCHYRDKCIINGLLFIYNHDGKYDKNFRNIIGSINQDKINIPKGRKLFVIGPEDVSFLSSVTNDIFVLRGQSILPDEKSCKFYYPDLVEKRANSNDDIAATIEMLSSPFIILKYCKNNKKGMRFYYRKQGKAVEEFLYLFDYLFHYQQMQDNDEIFITLFSPDEEAAALFDKAKIIYSEDKDNKNDIIEILKKVKFETMSKTIPQFSNIQIGME